MLMISTREMTYSDIYGEWYEVSHFSSEKKPPYFHKENGPAVVARRKFPHDPPKEFNHYNDRSFRFRWVLEGNVFAFLEFINS